VGVLYRFWKQLVEIINHFKEDVMRVSIIACVVAATLASCSSNNSRENKTFSNDGDSASADGTLKGPGYLSVLEFKNDYPTNETVDKLYDAIDFQRACQAYIWAVPTVSLNEMYVANKKTLNSDFNDMVVITSYANPDNVALTGNNNTIYGLAFIDLSKAGPVVIESPAGGYGVIDDYWQRPVTEIGPLGPDKGKGGKYLLLPPGYKEKPPAGYFTVSSTTNKVMYLVRGFVKDNDIQPAVKTLQQAKIYPLAQAGNPPATKIVNGSQPVNTIAPRGYEYWQRLAEIIHTEPVQERDRFFLAMLKPLGIEKGKPFNPDERQKRILTQAADFGFRMAQTISMAPRTDSVIAYPGTHWEYVLPLNPNQETTNYSQLDERTDYTFEAITVAAGMILKIPGVGSQYLSAAKDKDGDWLDGGKDYQLHVAANVPAKEFWSLIVYDNGTRSMIQSGDPKISISSQDQHKQNSDGSIDIYFGPKAPAGKENNWVKTISGKGWFAYFRWYSPTEAFFDKSWKLPDIEKAK
jgi:hypothetical protein